MSSRNTVLYDIYSIIDIEASIYKFLVENEEVAKDLSEIIDIDSYNIHKKIKKDDKSIEFNRMNNPYGLLRQFIKPMELNQYLSLRDTLYESLKEVILQDKYAVFTRAETLISAYNKAGNGVVQNYILCNDSKEKQFLQQRGINATYIIGKHEEIEMQDKYSRIISGDFRFLLKVNYGGPKSIVILNYRENFLEEDMTILRPELVILLGDIHDIKVFQAYSSLEANIALG